MTNPPYIVACYIVKNEANNLGVSINSVKRAANEIAVADTGSTDDTVQVAKSLGATVYSYKWNDNFADARNFCLDKLKGDWAVFLDADEYFDEETSGNLRAVIERQSKETNLILINRNDVDESGKTMLSIYVPRIFRIKPSLRYIGAIHEELRENGEIVTGVTAVRPDELNLIHTGYAGNLGKEKAIRNLKILLREFKSQNEPKRLYGYIAEAYDGLGDRESAMKYAYLDIKEGRQPVTFASRSYRLLLAKLAQNPNDNEERKKIARMAVEEYPELPEFRAEYAEALASSGKYQEAAKAMQEAIKLGTKYNGIEPTVYSKDMRKIWENRLSLWESVRK